MVTEDGLEIALSTVVALERPDLAQQAVDLVAQQNGFKIKMTELEDGILEQLANAEGDVTENIALIENLEDSKATSIEIGEKMIIAKETEVVIEKAREEYHPVANRGSLLFFLLSDPFKIHTFHFYSPSSFEIVLTRAVAGREPGDLWDEEQPRPSLPRQEDGRDPCGGRGGQGRGRRRGGEGRPQDLAEPRLPRGEHHIRGVQLHAARSLRAHKLIATMLMLRMCSARTRRPPR